MIKKILFSLSKIFIKKFIRTFLFHQINLFDQKDFRFYFIQNILFHRKDFF